MSENSASSGEPRRIRRSVLAKIFVTMLAMAVAIVATISSFFFFVLAPTVGRAVDRVAGEYVQLLAADNPDLTTAQGIATRLELDVRYQGPRGAWSTDARLPSIADAREASAKNALLQSIGRKYHLVSQADGGTYLFAWRFHRLLDQAHVRILAMLVTGVTVIVFIAHGILRRAVRPLEWLHNGFAGLSRGDFTVSVERTSDDEFGDLALAFNRMVERVRQMVHERDQLLQDVSHELRSPLTRMRVALALSPENDQKLRLLSNVAEMETMVTELLEIERLRSGRGLHLERCLIGELMRELLQNFESRDPGIELEPVSEQLVLQADCARLYSVLSNILENALKYSLPDSQPIRVSVRQYGDSIEIRVDDDGPGIPESDLPHLFEPFYRVDRSRSRRTGGYGLGLSLCQRIVLAHGGSLSIENRKPRGSSACIRLLKTPRPSDSVRV